MFTLTDDFRRELNKMYSELSSKMTQIAVALTHRIFQVDAGWYSGHEHELPDGTWQIDSFPVPVISVKGFSEIHIEPAEVTVTARLKRDDALALDMGIFGGIPVEVFGVEHYYDTYYRPGGSVDAMREAIRASDEREIGFAFSFPFDKPAREYYDFCKLLRRKGFYY